MRRTQIVWTSGPGSSTVEQLDRLAAAGMDVARLNFSHGTHAEHAEVIQRIREAEARWNRPVAILQDLQGPKIRLGTFGQGGGGRVDLESGRPFALCRTPCVGSAERVFVSPPEYLGRVRAGDEIWMDDGMIQLRVEATTPQEVRCVVVAGGRISDHKGISLPHVDLPASCLTEKDVDDLRFGIEQRVDFVAVSFVRTADDIPEVRRFLEAQGADIPLVATLERHEVLDNLPPVVGAVAAPMAGRGRVAAAVSDAAASAARALDARAIVAFRQSGFSARLISQERPPMPIIAFTPFAAVQRRLALTWGVTSRLIRKVETTDEMVEEIEATLLGDGTVRADDVLVIISGSPMWVTGTTNLVKLHRVGERR